MKSEKHKLKFKCASSNPRVTSSSPRVTSSNLRVTSSNPRVTSPDLQVTSSNPRIIESMKTPQTALKVSHFLRPQVLSCSTIREATCTFSFWW